MTERAKPRRRAETRAPGGTVPKVGVNTIDSANDRGAENRFRRPIIAIGVAATALLIGYGDLWRGGSSVSAMLLTVGYMILVPIAIMVGPRRDR